MTRRSFTALLCSVWVGLALVVWANGASASEGVSTAGPRLDAAPPAAATSRAPLSMLAGDVPWPEPARSDAGAPCARDGSILLPRVPPDEFLASLMDSVSLDRVTGTIQRLQDFSTRYVVSDSCWAAASWLADEFESYGYEGVTYDTFRCWSYQDTVDAANVIAVKPGTTRPDEYVVIGGHYDSISTENFNDPDAYAPGADDNATGVAGVLEAARILAPHELERSVVFALWSGEETGLRGSRAWVTDAVAAGMDIIVYLNMDVIGYTDEDPPVAIVYSDSLSLAVAGLMKDLIIDHTPYGCVTTVQPIGASDQNSFWEQGYNVLDTSSGAGWSPYHHTPYDVIDHVDLELSRALSAVNVAATAALALVAGEDANLPPETVLDDNCAAMQDTLGMTPRFEWSGVDFDGEVTGFEYRVVPPTDGPSWDRMTGGAAGADRVWHPLPPDSTGITLDLVEDGPHTFEVRAVDDDATADATPAAREFVALSWLAPRITVAPRFGRAPDGQTARVFENERLVFDVAATAAHYCSSVEDVEWTAGGVWSGWAMPDSAGVVEVVVRPTLGDTCVVFRARAEHGSVTETAFAFEVVPAPMTEPLLHVDDWFGQEMAEAEHDAVFDALLAGLPHETWDPYEHIQGYEPQLPTMEELGAYRTVLWSLGDGGTLLEDAQAESVYHEIEGYVRAGGNLIIEGFSPLLTFAAVGPFQLGRSFAPGDFVYDHAGIDSMRNAGALADPQVPGTYGYAFLGGTSICPADYPHAPVDTLGTWAGGYALYGGLPSCEVYSTFGAARRIHWFDAYVNAGLDEKPCLTLSYPQSGTGSVAAVGYPLCYIQRDPARVVVERLLDDIALWQEPADVVSFIWDAQRDYVFFVWYLSPFDGPQGAMLERRIAGEGDYAPLGTELLTPDEDDRYRFFDHAVEPGVSYEYRLRVTEAWGGQTLHGPWTIEVPADLSADRLEPPHPNPTSGGATITYTVADEHRWVRINVYSAGGRLVRKLVDGPAGRGRHETGWDGLDADGNRAASGVYFVRADFGEHALERKLVLLR